MLTLQYFMFSLALGSFKALETEGGKTPKDIIASKTYSSTSSYGCPDGGWVAHDGNCYKNVASDKTWSECQALCASEGANMLCIPDAATNTWIYNNIVTHSCDVWIGITDETTEGHWEWPAGCTSSYYDWASYGEPNGGTGSNCARIMFGYSGQWGDRHCSTDYDCACQTSVQIPSGSPTPGPTTSPTSDPTCTPSIAPSIIPSLSPTSYPSSACPQDCCNHPTLSPAQIPSYLPTIYPTVDCPTSTAEIFPEPSEQTLNELFDTLDIDGNGELDEVELEELFRKPACACCAPQSLSPTNVPSTVPSTVSSLAPTRDPTRQPSKEPSNRPTRDPTRQPSKEPTDNPTMTTSCSGSCPDGSWLTYDGNCYKNMDVATTWSECEALCASEGATMLCIPDATTNQWVSNNIMTHYGDVWIGITDEANEGHWEWPAGCASTYYDWASYGEPNGGTSDNCARMLYSSRPAWGDRLCSYDYDCACQIPLSSLCDDVDSESEETPAPSQLPSDAPSLPNCLNGWLGYGNSCYKTVSYDETFESCNALCVTEGASMLCIADAATNYWIGSNLMTSGGDLWIGLDDLVTEGQWEWTSGCDSSYFDWNSGAPGGGTVENCARIQYGSRPKWNDRECHFHFDCACQYPLGH